MFEVAVPYSSSTFLHKMSGAAQKKAQTSNYTDIYIVVYILLSLVVKYKYRWGFIVRKAGLSAITRCVVCSKEQSYVNFININAFIR